MSEVKVNKITPTTNCGTVTLGDSGDTILIPSGVTLSNQGTVEGVSDINWDTTAKTTNFTAVSGNGYFVNTTSGAITVTLPATPTAGDFVGIKDYANTADTNNITIARNGSNIQGTANNFIISTEGLSIILIYVDGTQGWVSTGASKASDIAEAATFITATGGTITTCGNYKIHTFTGPGTFCVSSVGNPLGGPNTIDYLVVAGGGAGSHADDFNGGGGGGGAGGYRESSGNTGCYTASPLATPTGITVTATAYPITVGGGGTGPVCAALQGTSGSNSVFSTITSTGGGAGASSNTLNPGLPGGSGGGGARSNICGTFGSGNTPPTSPPQGNSGGVGYGSTAPIDGGGGGGGGAGGVGGNSSCSPTVSAPIVGGTGGTGTATAVTGSPLFYAGGGGGGSTGCAVGASGGSSVGGDGGGCVASPTNSPGKAGTANRGGGGGGGAARASGANPFCASGVGGGGGAGGSGIVIIRYKYQ